MYLIVVVIGILFRVFEMMELVPYKANFQKNLEYPMEIYEAHAQKRTHRH